MSLVCRSKSNCEAGPEKASPDRKEASVTRGEQGGEREDSEERGDRELME